MDGSGRGSDGWGGRYGQCRTVLLLPFIHSSGWYQCCLDGARVSLWPEGHE